MGALQRHRERRAAGISTIGGNGKATPPATVTKKPSKRARILTLISQRGHMTAHQVQALTGFEQKTVSNHLYQLKAAGKIELVDGEYRLPGAAPEPPAPSNEGAAQTTAPRDEDRGPAVDSRGSNGADSRERPASNTLAKDHAQAFLMQAADLMAERGKQYDQAGAGERSMAKTVAAFNAITGHKLSEPDGWLLMLVLKQVRQWQVPGRFHRDSAEDGVAYAALLAESLANEGDGA